MPSVMPAVTFAAPAKVNLSLEILGRRGDGFHELETVFQTLELHDRIEVAIEKPGRGISLACSDPELPLDQGNLAWRAAAAVCEQCPDLGAVRIALDKRVPAGAGLGGGSSDAATVLRALARLEPRVARLDLSAIAARLGSDVPFFLIGGTAHALGRGEALTPLPDAPSQAVTVLMPAAHLPTPAVYAELSDAERAPRTARGAAWWTDHLQRGDTGAFTPNRLTGAARRLCRPLADLLDWLETRGIPHLMSGSGSACVAFAAIAPPQGVKAWSTSFRPRVRLDQV
jgi:4-diphosphocytidyl-2-C-methyl-D-erythritol kinase